MSAHDYLNFAALLFSGVLGALVAEPALGAVRLAAARARSGRDR